MSAGLSSVSQCIFSVIPGTFHTISFPGYANSGFIMISNHGEISC